MLPEPHHGRRRCGRGHTCHAHRAGRHLSGGRRVIRRGVRRIIDGHLAGLDLKRAGLSNHTLRHTGATLAYKYTHDLRAVQDLLGHADPRNHCPLPRRVPSFARSAAPHDRSRAARL
jgi:integrase